jgi:hypothetical protein
MLPAKIIIMTKREPKAFRPRLLSWPSLLGNFHGLDAVTQFLDRCADRIGGCRLFIEFCLHFAGVEQHLRVCDASHLADSGFDFFDAGRAGHGFQLNNSFAHFVFLLFVWYDPSIGLGRIK